MKNLTTHQEEALAALRAAYKKNLGSQTAADLQVKTEHLRALEKKGMAAAIAPSMGRALLWKLTDAGLQAGVGVSRG